MLHLKTTEYGLHWFMRVTGQLFEYPQHPLDLPRAYDPASLAWVATLSK